MDIIPSIYNYCDGCCWRCRFTERCAVARAHREAEATAPVPFRPAGWASPDSDPQISSEEFRAACAAAERHAERVGADRLVEQGRDYTLTAFRLTRAIRHHLARRVDPPPEPDVMGALERIEEVAATVSGKIYRAVSDTFEEDFDPDDLQSDANGSAKVAWLLVEESRRAWRTLMAPGRGMANGVPARLVAMLDDLEAGLRARFPRALEFVRPGFDTDPFTVPLGRTASDATRAAERQGGHA